MRSTSTSEAVRVLRELFATRGLPEVLVSDNGTWFTSNDFKNFLARNGIRHSLVPPASNGQAERMVKETKNSLGKLAEGDWHTKLSRFLFSNHSTPSTVTGMFPAELLLKRKLRTVFDHLYPNVAKEIQTKQEGQQTTGRRQREFRPNDRVWAKSHKPGEEWREEVVTKV